MAFYNLGIDGDTSEHILKRFQTEADARKPHIIILAVGVNDACYIESTNQPMVSPHDFEKNLDTLISLAKAYKATIFVVGLVKGSDEHTVPLPQSTTGKCFTKDRVREYDALTKKVALKHGVTFVDVFDHLSDQDFSDGLHPNASGHKKIADQFIQSLIQAY